MAANTSGIKCHNFCFQKTTPDLVIVRMLLIECYKGAGFSFMCSFKFRGFLSRTFLASLSKTICWPHILTSSSLSRVVCLALTIIVYWIAIFYLLLTVFAGYSTSLAAEFACCNSLGERSLKHGEDVNKDILVSHSC